MEVEKDACESSNQPNYTMIKHNWQKHLEIPPIKKEKKTNPHPEPTQINLPSHWINFWVQS